MRYASAMKPAADLVLVKLNDEQIALARQANGARRRVTHALLCGSYGQMFGSEKQCAKYYDAWRDIFRHLFRQVYKTERHPIRCYEPTFNLVTALSEGDDRIAGPACTSRSAEWS